MLRIVASGCVNPSTKVVSFNLNVFGIDCRFGNDVTTMPLNIKPADQSRFTYKNLRDLNDNNKAYKSPLAVICHVDVNAFFAQYEQNRLNLSHDDPVVCLQWNSIIAVSYAARKYGINRMDTLESAKRKCPHLVVAHTAVFKRGDPTWKYVNYRPSPVNHKVSLDPYRRESRKMMRIFQSFCDLVEKASVDESFMDFGRLVFKRLMLLFPELVKGMERTSDRLPQVPLEGFSDLDWQGIVILCDEDEEEKEGPVISDWDDVVDLIGSNLAYELRQMLIKELNYTTSAGVGRVKTLAKLASGYNKPDLQTIVRSRAIPDFLKRFSIKDFWSLGGKIGDLVLSRLSSGTVEEDEDQIGYIRDHYSLKDLISRFDHDRELAQRVYDIVRGQLYAALSSRIDIKSMASNKNFRGPSVNCSKDLLPWLDVFVGDLVLRLQDLDEETDTVRRPTKFALGMTCGRVTKLKQCTMTPIKDYAEFTKRLKQLSVKLLGELESTRKGNADFSSVYPCIQASLTISGFISLEGFANIDELMKKQSTEGRSEGSKPVFHPRKRRNLGIATLLTQGKVKSAEGAADDYICSECRKRILKSNMDEHKDYHVALKLDQDLNSQNQKHQEYHGQSQLPF
ncbi:hypothetical protein FOA43_001822 [Brettanomyces nanus]|uniref:Uncharacterized protein n=1 Tax=Eeniella nana TaxID=13502 RepID=A0A875S358_EENNA|nr:uncharacterized protein FOA43_001822 [Brettanomyces nanus]QPG74492.1 hypothetical protein FOA43_001822 [Brettanomyces nanus]